MIEEIIITTLENYQAQAELFYQACNRQTRLEATDTLVVALMNNNPVGIVRLCYEKETFVLRTMQIHPQHQRKGIGSVLLQRFHQLLQEREIAQVFCMPYDYLESFYAEIGFLKINPTEAPIFLQERLAGFQRDPAEKAILMKCRGSL